MVFVFVLMGMKETALVQLSSQHSRSLWRGLSITMKPQNLAQAVANLFSQPRAEVLSAQDDAAIGFVFKENA